MTDELAERSVLLVCGAEDVATPVAQAEQLRTLLPNSTLAVIPAVGHFPHLEAQSSVVAALQPFLLARGTDTGND